MSEIGDGGGGGLMLVGMGASAGGVEALLRFFEHTPADSGMAFAVLLHTAPEDESRLAEVLQKKTRMPVTQVTEAERVEPNRVYCIPPDKEVVISGGYLKLVEPETPGGRHAPVDLFFRALASGYKDKAIAVLLSGADGDGSCGLGHIRGEGGVSIAQDPAEAEHATMPRSAIETGYVDFVMPAASMPEKLVSIKQNAERIRLPPAAQQPPDLDEESLREVMALLRTRTRHDFTHYKRSTLLRRVERRLQVTESEDVPEYLGHVRQHPEELQGLLRDLLISVTNFFRDPEVFRRLGAEVVPQLFAGKGDGDQIRVWVAACATGEEAYSVAMLMAEHAVTLTNPPAIQVFATDIDEEALAQARQGVYPHTIAADVSPERLRRFFVKEGQYYRVRRELRETVLFAPHNVLRDPPFSKLDLISCRNLLIYIDRYMQERILEVFHAALRPGGHLLLGTSESAEGLTDLFRPVAKKHRIYKRHGDGHAVFRLQFPAPASERLTAPPAAAARAQTATAAAAETFSYGELHYRMLEALAPPSVLVNANYDIVHLSENSGRYLQLSGGEPTRNLFKVAHPDLRLELRALLITAAQEDKPVGSRVAVRLGGEQHFVRVVVRPLDGQQVSPGFMLVVFEETDGVPEAAGGNGAEPAATARPDGDHEAVVRQLEAELERTRAQLRTMVEQYETSTEELKASNEELQAMNEELHAASEELETSKEEIQSVNEELTTLNAELRDKVEEVSRTIGDLQNLTASTRIATLFLDRSMRLTQYTPSVRELFNIIPGDIGRPLSHITHRLDYASLAEDAEGVLSTLHTAEREVSTTDGRFFLARLLPYRTPNDKIDGVVLTFTDITEIRRAEEALNESEEQFRRAIEDAPIPVIMQAEDGEVLHISRTWTELTGYTIEDVPTLDAWLTRAYGEGADDVRDYVQRLFTGDERAQNVEFAVRTRDDSLRRWSFSASPPGTLRDGRRFIVGMALDITERTQGDEALHWKEDRLSLLMDTVEDYAIMLLDTEGRYTSWNRGAEKIFGFTAEEATGQPTDIIFTPEDRAAGAPEQELRTADAEGRAADERWHIRKDGSRFYVSGVMVSLPEGRGYAKIARDLTGQQQIQMELRRAWDELEKRVEERTAELASANSALRDEVRERRRIEEERLELLRRVVTTQEDERRRISRELHDQLGQSLTALRLKLEGLSAEAGRRSKLRSRIGELAEIAQQLDLDVDFLAWELRPSALDDLGLIVALSDYTQEWGKHFGVTVNFHSAGLGDARLAPLVETNLYRIAQEALNNVSKHAAATRVDLLLERRDDHAVLIVEDDGRGFDPDEVSLSAGGRGMGLIGMRERAALVCGSIEIESRPGEGSTVFARVPIKLTPAAALDGGDPLR